MLQIQIGAIVQGVAAAFVLVGLLVFYIDRMSKVSKSLENISGSVESVEEDIRRVDLKDMEKTITKLESFIEMQLQQGYGNGNSINGGPNSVETVLKKSGIGVTISYLGDPSWHAGLNGREDYEGPETVFKIEFDEEVDTEAVIGRVTQDEELIRAEDEIFAETVPSRVTAHSPFVVSSSAPTDDQQIIAEWVSVLLDSIDEQIQFMKEERLNFDQIVEENINR
ncbi:hypothetical protein [Haloferax sp. DFSO60]|uniref:hypothetical protein n=1 Tax=Haloferax sp. DFSO60 TaxID=3388652 RepID=UPI00397DCEC0